MLNQLTNKTYFLFGIITFSLLSFVSVDEVSSHRAEIGINLDIFLEVYNEVNSNYVDGTKPGEMIKTGIDAMLASLDPYTVFYPQSEIEDYKLMVKGTYGGIGATVRKIDDYVVIAEPYVGFPAYKAGLRAGDQILEVDGNDVKGKTPSDLTKLLKGNPGTDLTIIYQRPGKTTPSQVTFKRAEVKFKNVPYYGMINDSTAYIKTKSFMGGITQEVKMAYLELKKDYPVKGLILDLRFNPGGLLTEAINMVNLFVPKGQMVVETRGKLASSTKDYKTLNQAMDLEIPLVVLINGRSASASEIVSGSIQDLDRGVVLGQKSYGKGLVQNTKQLKYDTRIKITTAKYYIPSGRCIQAIDYSKRDEHGKVQKTPDSLLTEFKTLNGRTVLDGAGIFPDVELPDTSSSAILQVLIGQNILFKYATQYVLEHDSIDSPAQFTLGAEDFKQFKAFADSVGYDYKTGTDQKLEALKEKAESEEFLDAISESISAMQAKLDTIKAQDLEKHQEEILRYLQHEIVTRYYFKKGAIENKLKDDPYIFEAVEILADSVKYHSILNNQ